MYAEALSIIEEQYLRIDEVDPGEALVLAAEAAEDAVPWLIVEQQGDTLVLSHGEQGEFARVAITPTTVAALQPALENLERTLRGAPSPIPDDVDISVELLRGVSRALDRHSVVMYRDRLARFNERIKGKLIGIGSQISLTDGEPVITEVFPDSPAERGGLLEGDVLLQVDGFSTVGLAVDQVVGRIRGEADTEVVLTVRRGEVELPLSLTRAEVRIPNVHWEMRDAGVGVMSISNFSEQTTHFMKRGLSEFQDADDLRGIVIDLRGNTGGSMRQACYSVDQFLTGGTVLRTEGRDGAEVRNLMRRYPARIDGDEPEVPVVVLIDRKSASASEILAGALMLSDRAVLIGERSHGKGTVQRRDPLRRDDIAGRVEMKLTVAEYKLTDARVPIEAGIGLEPDLWVLPARFSRGGASLPDAGSQARSTPELHVVEERPGWREGTERDDEDDLVAVAEQILLAVPEGRWERADVLAAVDMTLPRLRSEQAAELQQTFGYRGIDWSPAPEPVLLDAVSVKISVVDPPIAGEAVEVRAEVTNNGAAPIHQLRVHLSADSRLPWSGLTLPVGRVEPGESALGSAMVTLPASSPSRLDLVTPTAHADLAAPKVLEPVPLSIDGRPTLALSASATLRAAGEAHHELVVDLHNHSQTDLAELRARLALEVGTGIELQAREIAVEALQAGSQQQLVVPMILPEAGLDEELELRVDAGGWGRVLRVPLDLIETGADQIAPPRATAALPTEAPMGPLDVTVVATDDRQIASVTAWWDNDKIAWSDGGGGRDELLLPLTITPAHHVLTVRVEDDQGAVRYENFHVEGMPDDAEADASPD